MSAVDGFARCTNQACDEFDQDRPIPLEKTIKEIRGESPLQNLVISESVYHHAVNDDDMICPGCGQPCAVLPEKRRTVPLAGTYPSS